MGVSVIFYTPNSNLANYSSSSHTHSWSSITDKPTSFTPASHNHDTVYEKIGQIPVNPSSTTGMNIWIET